MSTASTFRCGGTLPIAAIIAAVGFEAACWHDLGCAGDHSGLAKTNSSSSGHGGAGGSGGGGAAGGSASSSGTGGIIEPPGPTKLTVVNGVVDHDAVRLCFRPYPDASGSGALPWPGVEGLPFARGTGIAPIDEVVPTDSDVELVVVAGELAQTGGKTCNELVAAPPQNVEARSLGVLPETVFAEEKSILLVTMGCVGGPGHSDQDLQELVCGLGYSEQTPNASLVAGFMSRLANADKLPMQFVHAIQALDTVDLRLRPGTDGAVAQYVVPQWSLGSIAPFPPYMKLATADLFDVADATLEIYVSTQPEPMVVTPLSEAFANSLLSVGDVSDGNGLVFVGVGPQPGIAAGSWWNGFAFTVMAADP